MVHVQKDGCVCSYDMVCFTCTYLRIKTHHTITVYIYNHLPEDEPSCSKHVDDVTIEN